MKIERFAILLLLPFMICSDDATSHGGYVYEQSSAHPWFILEYGHVNPYDGIGVGDTVTAGQRIASATYPSAANGCWDLQFATAHYYDSEDNIPTVVARSHCGIDSFVSDEVAAALAANGGSADDLVISKAHREENPCTLGDLQESGDYLISFPDDETNADNRVIFE